MGFGFRLRSRIPKTGIGIKIQNKFPQWKYEKNNQLKFRHYKIKVQKTYEKIKDKPTELSTTDLSTISENYFKIGIWFQILAQNLEKLPNNIGNK